MLRTITFAEGVPLSLIRVDPGAFTMGVPGCSRLVRITKPFYLGQFPLTVLQLFALSEYNIPPHTKVPSGRFWTKHRKQRIVNQFRDGLDCPAYVQSIFGAYITLTQLALCVDGKDSLPFRFPTEAEWEYACRAGTTSAFSCGDKLTEDYANFGQSRDVPLDSESAFTSVDLFPPNAWGFYDMHGNMSELCADVYADVIPSELVVDPLVEESPKHRLSGRIQRVLRGGSAYCTAVECASAARRPFYVAEGAITGLRVALPADAL